MLRGDRLVSPRMVKSATVYQYLDVHENEYRRLRGVVTIATVGQVTSSSQLVIRYPWMAGATFQVGTEHMVFPKNGPVYKYMQHLCRRTEPSRRAKHLRHKLREIYRPLTKRPKC